MQDPTIISGGAFGDGKLKLWNTAGECTKEFEENYGNITDIKTYMDQNGNKCLAICGYYEIIK